MFGLVFYLKTKFELNDKKYVQGTQKFVRFRWFFELWEFELKEFFSKGLLVNSEGAEEFVRFRWAIELQEFELHEFNCTLFEKIIQIYVELFYIETGFLWYVEPPLEAARWAKWQLHPAMGK